MFRFTIEYYYERHHTGSINVDVTRKAVVIANNKEEALEKIQRADADYICVAELLFEEMAVEGYER